MYAVAGRRPTHTFHVWAFGAVGGCRVRVLEDHAVRDAVEIRPMREDEAEQASSVIRAAIRAHFPAVYSADVVEAVATVNSAAFLLGLAPRQTNYVLLDGGAVVAMMGLKKNEIGHLFVHPDHAGRGLGRRLVEFAAAAIRSAGFADMFVHAGRNAVGFYQRCGFTREGEGSFDVGPGLPLHYISLRASLRQA
jgi:putative acetyltransferase